MAASRSRLEALLARVQQRASEPRPSAPVSIKALEGEGVLAAGGAASAAGGAALPAAAPLDTDDVEELADDDIEEYDDDLIEILDEAEELAPAPARTSDVVALAGGPERRPVASVTPLSAARTGAARAPAGTSPVLRAEPVAGRPSAATQVVHTQGVRRELARASFVALLDASLKLGS